MATPIILRKQLTAASANNLALSQTPTSGTPLTLTALAATGLDSMRRILLTTGSEASQRTLVLTGKGNEGEVISETLTIPATTVGTVQSLRDYLTLTSALPLGGGWSNAVTLGTSAVGSSEPQIVNWHVTSFEIGFALELISGTGIASLEVTRDIPYAPIQIYNPGYAIMAPINLWYPWPELNSVEGSAIGTVDDPITAFRLTISAGTGLWQLDAVPAGFRT